jgi:hypothetical protein
MQTIVLKQPHSFPVPIEAPSIQVGLGSGAVSLRDLWPRTRYEFAVATIPLGRQEAEQLEGVMRYLKGGQVLWYDGSDYGKKENPVFVGHGDGVTTDFFLPHDHVFGASVVMYVNGVVTTGWTITDASGLIRFTSAPAAEAEITAKFECRFRCFLLAEKVLLKRDRIFRNLYRLSFTLREKPNA